MPDCPTEKLMARYVAGACADDAAARIQEHVTQCRRCADWIAEAEANEAVMHGVRAALDDEVEDAQRGRRARTLGPRQVELPPRIIEGYEIQEELGRGGMAVVYLAQQERPKREVAIKVISTGVPSRSALRRFEYESQILARLQHPNIAQVYEVGKIRLEAPKGWPEDGPARSVPYFVMEYIPEAGTITTCADEHNFNTRARLELFAQVCDAVHHGHQKGIIHRDLKPGNILVDSSGHVKVIDFGVARSTDSDIAITTIQTNVGQIIGTLQYMSPEQCDGDPHELDTRSDVYALGVVLYELLCGRLPYDVKRTAIHEVARVIREEVPTRPSTHDRRLRGDVETIVLKALEKDRGRRYQSAADLARDIRRYLTGEPIEARPPTAWTRAVRWVARHPLMATATACTLVGAVVGISAAITSNYFVVRYELNRPDRIVVNEDGSEAGLFSVSDGLLHRWKAGRGGAIGFAELVERPAEFGGGELAVVGFHNGQSMTYPNSVCAYEVGGNLDVPIWHGRIELDDIPESLLGLRRGPELSHVSKGMIADVFPDPAHPGDEIVAVHHHGPYSQCAIRVYDLKGEVLYQVWHDGNVLSCYWMSAAKLLVFLAFNGEAYWEERGRQGIRNVHPRVVFAIRPRLGFIEPGYLRTVPGSDPQSPAWYRCLYTAEAMDRASGPFLLGRSGGPYDSGRSVRLALVVDEQSGASVEWVLNETGNEIPGSRMLSDNYIRNLNGYSEDEPNRLPDPGEFYLDPLLPLVSP